MKRTRTKSNWLITIFLLFVMLVGKSESQTKALDLHDLLKLALQKNTDIQVQSAENGIVKWKKWQSISQWLPQVRVEGDYVQTSGKNDVPDFVSADGIIVKSAMVHIQQNLFDADTWAGLKENSINKRRQKYLYFSTRQHVLFEVIQTYFEELNAKGEIKVFQDNLNDFKLLYEQSQMLYKNGVVPEIDVKKSLVELLLQKNSLIRAEKNMQNVLDHLKELINLPMNDSLRIVDFHYQKINLDSLQHYTQVALENNPQLSMLKMELSLYKIHRTSALLQHLPSANVSIWNGWNTIDPLRQYNRGWQVWLNVSIPIWQWGTIYANRQIAGLQYNQTMQRIQQLKKQIIKQVNRAYRECQIQQQQMHAMQESKEQAEQAVQMARTGYQEGTLTNLNLINTQKLLTETNINYLQAMYDFYIAKAQLYLAIGKLKENMEWLEN